MKDIILIIHFIGLAMGLGTSFAHMFLGMSAQKMAPEEAKNFLIKTFALSRMGQIGLTLLVVSGIYLIVPYWDNISNMPLLITKLILVLFLGALIGILSSTAKKAMKGDYEIHSKKMQILGKLTLVTALSIVVLAVKIFH